MEIILEPRVSFKKANRATLVRRVAAKQVVCAVPSTQGNPRPPKAPREPRIKELMHMALEWQRLLESGHVASRADIARRENLSQARVTQIMYLLKLAPEIQDHILKMPNSSHRPSITDRSLRTITQINDHKEQLEAFQGLM